MSGSIGFFINSILLGIGLAMDAFSVSIVNALNEPRMHRSRMVKMAGVYAFFQFAMPLIGWIAVHTIVQVFHAFEKAIPWIALVLLLLIGGSMLVEGLRNRGSIDARERAGRRVGTAAGLMQGVATSIDALSVGFTISEYGIFMALTSALIIAAVTYIICLGGLLIGKKVGEKITNKASILGGIILIGIGIEIFLRGVA